MGSQTSRVAFSTTEETLKQVFSEAGEVDNVKLFRKHGKSDESRGMGVVTFTNPESARWAAKHLRERDVDGRPMWVSTHAEDRKAPSNEPRGLGGKKVFF